MNNTTDKSISQEVPKTPDQPIKVQVPKTPPRKGKLNIQIPAVNLSELLEGFDDSIPRHVSKKLRF